MKTLHCADAGFDCNTIIKAATIGEVLDQAAIHAKEAHGVSATPELIGQITSLIKDEELKAN